jgi:pimeloyl-ACP methyl ester carboxylesterase
MMDFEYVVAPALIVFGGAVVAWLSIRRVQSLRAGSHRGVRNLSQQIALIVVAGIALFAAASSGINAILLEVNRRELPGRICAVNGRRMRIDCTGDGSPTLVLEAGGGNDGLNWGGVQPVLAKTTRVCSYDRAGFGGSEAAPGPRDADHVAADLHGLLHAAGIQFPVVLLGHSVGGLFIRDYASHYPGEVAGLIFVDSASPSQFRNRAWLAHNHRGAGLSFDLVLNQAMFVLGVPRLLSACSASSLPGSDAAAARLYAEDRCQEPFATMTNEADNYDRSAEETLHSGPFGATPVLIISHDPEAEDPNHQMDDLEKATDQMQEDLKKLSTRSRRIIARGSNHFVHRDRPDLIDAEVPLFIEQIRGTAPEPEWGATVVE